MSKTVSEQELKAQHPRGSIWRTTKAILWSFAGLRKGSDFVQDSRELNILHIVFVGLALAFIFVIGLMIFVHQIAKL